MAWKYRRRTEVTYDLAVSSHPTVNNNSGYVQDISGDNLETSAYSPIFKSVTSGWTSNVSNIIYRHYSAIPQNSYITIYFSVNGNGPFFDYLVVVVLAIAFNLDGTGASLGVTVKEKDLNNYNTNNTISITDLRHDLLILHQAEYSNLFVDYIRFKINQNNGISGGSGKYIEIYINDVNPQHQNLPGLDNTWYNYLRVSIEVRSSDSRADNSNLLGSVYNKFMGVNQP